MANRKNNEFFEVMLTFMLFYKSPFYWKENRGLLCYKYSVLTSYEAALIISKVHYGHKSFNELSKTILDSYKIDCAFTHFHYTDEMRNKIKENFKSYPVDKSYIALYNKLREDFGTLANNEIFSNLAYRFYKHGIISRLDEVDDYAKITIYMNEYEHAKLTLYLSGKNEFGESTLSEINRRLVDSILAECT